ncbi:MAG: hypothetical protein ACOYU3_00680 [Bacillota bacterium]
MKLSLKNPEHLHIPENSGNTFKGCDQEWFGSLWQRKAGCGPSVATNVLLYLHGTGTVTLPEDVHCKTECIRLMETLWRHVTPTAMGVHTLDLFCNGVKDFALSQGTLLQCRTLGIPQKGTLRPALSAVVGFIQKAFESGCPVAFLNLSNGKVRNLDKWHWVTVVGLETGEDDGGVQARIYDAGKAFTIDLKLWHETTTLGGGFVYFEKSGQS